jgi:regulator of sirC expression with transglutaminase-like and TPR domain
MTDDHAEYLQQVGRMSDGDIDIAETALVLSAMDHAATPLARYRAHLDEMADAMAGVAGAVGNVGAAGDALRAVVAEENRYQGDRQTYDDMQNADLIRVIDRRRGLPVALGILYIHAGRGAGWDITGIRFPAHYLLRLQLAGERTIIDPFNEGARLDAPDLRKLVKTAVGDAAELDPKYLEPAGNRETLLRLQNNIRTRATRTGELERADDILQRMLMIAPEHADLHRDLAITEARKGNLRGAISACERYADLAEDERQRQDAARLLQKLKVKLN